LALIVKPDTTALERTPELASRVVETFDISLPETGLGRIAATEEFFGTSELLVRVVHSQLKADQIEKTLAAVHSAKTINNLERSDVNDFSSPYRMHFEIVDSQLAQTSGGESVFFIPTASLDDSWISLIKEMDDKLAADGLDLGEVSVREWRYRIVPPPGYRRVRLPESTKTTMGPATLTQAFSEGTDGTITSTVRLDSGKRRYTSQDLAAVKAAAEKLDDEDYIRLTFEQAAQALLDEGKTREALKEFRKLAELHPKEAVHHVQLSRALLAAGLGEMARTEAKLGVELEPSSAEAHETLAWVLEHDGIGRLWKPGFDFDGAKTAFEKAVELAPDDRNIRSQYAIFLEFNRNGERYAADMDLGPAIEQYRKIQDKLDEKSSLRRNLPFALFWMKRYSELKTASTPADIRIASIAASDGISAAIRDAGKLDASDRASSMDSAAALLMQTRLYEQAAALSRAGATGANAQRMLSRADQIERMHRYEDILTEKNDPATVAKQFFVRAFLGDRGEKLNPFLTKSGQQELRASPNLQPAIALRATAVLSGIGGLSASRTAADSAISSLTVETDGNDNTGYRIDFGAPLAGAIPNRASQYLYVVLEDREYRVLTASRSDFALAQGVLRFLEKGDLVSARKWLDWASDEADLGQIDVDALNTEAFLAVWLNSVAKDRARMRLAAASLLSTSPTAAATVLPILLEGRNTTTGLIRNGLSIAYGSALLALGRTEESLAVGQQSLRESPSSRVIFLVAECMLRLNRVDALATLLQQALPKASDVREVTLLLAAVELKQEKLAGVESRLKDLNSTGRNRGEERRIAAWFNLYRDQVTPANVAEAQQAGISWLRVLAALYASTGKTVQALSILSQSLDAEGKRAPDADDWFVLGRIYEEYGEIGAAEAAYRKAMDRKEVLPALDSASLLAKRRLDGLRTNR
jgi:tetratricopeptide (TPR) repeat protein